MHGAVIASTADPSKNLLSTESLGVTGLANHANYSGASFGGSVGFSGGSASPSPDLGVAQGDTAASVTRSDIAAGTIVVRNGDTSSLAGLDRNATDLQQEGLTDRFDVDAINRNIEAGRIAGEVGFRAAGDLAAAKGWEEGSMERTALHGVVGAAMAALGGGSALDGISGAVSNQLAFKAMYSFLENNLGLDPSSPLFASLMEAGSLAVGTAVGGTTGAAVASSATKNNWLKHYEAEQLEEATKACGPSNQNACALAEQLRGLNASRDAEYAAYATKVRAEAAEKGITLSLEEFDRQTAGYWASYDMVGRDAVYPGALFSRTYQSAGQSLVDALKLQGQLLQFAKKYAPLPILADTTPIGIGMLEGAGDTYGSWISGSNYFTGESLDPNQQRDGKFLSLVGLFMPGGLLSNGVKGSAQSAVRNEIQHELKEEVAKSAANTLRLAKPEFNVPQGYTVKVEADGIATVTGPQGGIYKSTGSYDSSGRQIYSDSSGKYFTLEDGRTQVASPNQNVGKDNATKGQQSDADYGKTLEGTGARSQVAYKDGVEVSPNTPGSVRLDYCIDGVCSMEVKNYNLTVNTSGLVRNVARQAIERVRHLPEGMEQLIVIDIRGQTVTTQQEVAIRKAISDQSNGVIMPESIDFMR
jgi:hypothetical protein